MARDYSRMILILLACSLLTVPYALAEVVAFDDLGLWFHNQEIYSGYAGLDWQGFYAMNVPYEFGSNYPTGYIAGMVSPEYVAYNFFGQAAEISSGTPFTFVSACLTAAWLDDLQITVEGFRGSSLEYTQTVPVSPTAWTLFNFNFVGVDRVRFTPSGGQILAQSSGTGTQFVMDNLIISNGTASETPETEVVIDIKPGSDENPINMRSKGVIPVAILSSETFNAPVDVDPSSLTFGHDGTEQSLASAKPEDVNGDGLLDLICHFFTQKTGFNCSDVEGFLKCNTSSFGAITVTDAVRIGPCK